MAIVALFFKSDAKVIHFCECCKKKIHIFSTISVNGEQVIFAYNYDAHKLQHRDQKG